MPSFILITGADAQYFELVKGTILSIREKPQGQNCSLGFIDLGCTPEQLDWLAQQVDLIQQVDWEFDFPARTTSPQYLKGLLVRPFLPKYFPGFEVYVWIDADAWVQQWQAIELFIRGADDRQGLAIVPELYRGNRLYGEFPVFFAWAKQHYEALFGSGIAQQTYHYPMLNAGIFALHKEAPHWQVWANCLEQACQRIANLITDQLSLNVAVYSYGLLPKTELLPIWCNWPCSLGLPLWDAQQSCLTEPYLPFAPIGILHLTGKKHHWLRLWTTERTIAEVSLRYESQSQSRLPEDSSLPPGDYISPGFQQVRADPHFPNLTVGDTRNCFWPYLRRQIPHHWYVDQRSPVVGFLSRDEAHILYNTALQFQGKSALEIGCWLGWSACHLALAGVELDVIDPILEKADFFESVSQSLRSAGVLNRVNLIPGFSPAEVEQLGENLQKRWSLIFIDGDHETPAPLQDAIVCERYAEPDALILFHDLASPAVTEGLDYLKQSGWQTMIYQTMQIMGVAWRGNVQPVFHQPDPLIDWQVPEHLQDYGISGVSSVPQTDPKLAIRVEALQQSLNLSQNNWILFPDWQQEEALLPELMQVFQAALKHPDRAELTLLFDSNGHDPEEINLLLSGVFMQLLYEESLEVTEGPEIALIPDLSKPEWQALKTQVTAQILLQQAADPHLTLLKIGQVPRYSVTELSAFELSS